MTATAKRPERPCLECGKRTTAKSQVCRTCTRPEDAEPTYEHAAVGGRWVQRGLIRVWVPDHQGAA